MIRQNPNAVGNFKTYSILAPLNTHFRKARCEEVECKAYREGWTYDVRQLDAELVQAIRVSGRKYRTVEHLGVEYWVFPPEQQCFATHRIRIDRPEFFYVTPHARSFNRRTASPYVNAADWVDDFATHQDKIKTQRGV